MPNNAYRTLPVRVRLVDYPFTHAVALGMLYSAVILLLSLGIHPTGYEAYMGIIILAFAVPATGLIITGLQWRGSVVVGYGLERTGHWLAMGVWLIDLWVLCQIGAFASMPTAVIFLIAHALRAYRLGVETSRIKRYMREKAKEAQAGDSE